MLLLVSDTYLIKSFEFRINKDMKLKYIIPSFMAVFAAVFTGCSNNDYEPTYLNEIRVSQSYVSLNTAGGSASINVSATSDWQLEKVFKVTTKDENGKNVDKFYETPEWLTVNQTSGTAGQSALVFSAEAGVGRSCELVISCGDKTQRVNIIQGIAEVAEATCAEVIAGPDSKTYRVTGTVTSIANTTYGNWYLNDGTGEVYIYGTLDSKGATKNFLSWGLEAGDQITVEGPKTTYNGTVELVDVTVVKIVKSLIKCDSLTVSGIVSEELPLEGGEIVAHLTCKGNGVAVEIPAQAQSWLGVVSSTVGENPTVTFRAQPNAGGDRSTTVTFTTTDGKKEYTSQATISQKGAIVECPISDFLAAEVGDTQYRLTGVITKIANATYGNVYIKDYSGEAYVYGIGAKGDFEKLGLKVGDVVTLVGKRAAYKDSPQMGGAVYEKSISVTEVSLSEFLAKAPAADVYYRISGTIESIANDTYGNLYLTDGTDKVYVYGCYPGWGATGDARKGLVGELGLKVGDKLSVIGVRAEYKGEAQLSNGVYFSHESAE